MSYLFDLHVHTYESSRCGQVPASDMIRRYHQLGYAGVVITDHITKRYVDGKCVNSGATSWQEKVEKLQLGYNDAKKTGEELGMTVLFGWEFTNISYHTISGIDLVTLGLDADFLLNNPQIDTMEGDEYIDLVQSAGGLVNYAHPYRHMPPNFVPPHTNTIAVEVLNACHHTAKYPGDFDTPALAFAKEHGKIQLAGCDAHRLHEVDGTGVLFNSRPTDNNRLLTAILQGDYKLMLQGKEWDSTGKK